jgi:methionine sulfoxide reductase heme-binding subunit
MRKWILTGTAGGLIAAVLVTSVSTRLGIVAVEIQRPDTHWFWYLSRAAGISAYLALALSVMWGLLLSTRLVDAWITRGLSVELHKWISAVALALIAVHALVLIGDPYVRFDLLDVLLPFASSYRAAAIALGVLSTHGSVVVFGSFWLRRRIGQRTWRVVHILAFPTFLGVTLHGMLAGTDSATAWMRSIYLLSSAVFIWLLAYRLISRTSAHSSAEPQSANWLRRSPVGRGHPAGAR